jgi:hypothetical protein
MGRALSTPRGGGLSSYLKVVGRREAARLLHVVPLTLRLLRQANDDGRVIRYPHLQRLASEAFKVGESVVRRTARETR